MLGPTGSGLSRGGSNRPIMKGGVSLNFRVRFGGGGGARAGRVAQSYPATRSLLVLCHGSRPRHFKGFKSHRQGAKGACRKRSCRDVACYASGNTMRAPPTIVFTRCHIVSGARRNIEASREKPSHTGAGLLAAFSGRSSPAWLQDLLLILWLEPGTVWICSEMPCVAVS